MNIFVINSGSSSLKYQLIEMPSEKVICSGIVERIGQEEGDIIHKTFGGGIEKVKRVELKIEDHGKGLQEVVSLLTDPENAVIKDPSAIDIVGHRVVHGGEKYSAPTRVTAEVKQEIRRLAVFAPEHNPAEVNGIETAEQIFKSRPQVAVFDTAFHQTLPKHALIYPGPYAWYERGIRRYGFHGISHQYVSRRAARLLGREADGLKLITCPPATMTLLLP